MPKLWKDMTDWEKWRADLSSTRIQLTYAVAILFALAVLKTILLITSVDDGAKIINALSIPFGAVLAYHMTGKWIDSHPPAEELPPPAPPEVKLTSTPEGGMTASITQPKP